MVTKSSAPRSAQRASAGRTTRRSAPAQRAPAKREPASSGPHWQSALDAITDALCLVDRRGKIRHCNKAFAALVGLPAEETIGKACCRLVHGRRGHPVGCPLPTALKSGVHQEAEYALGERRMRAKVDPILDSSGALSGAVQILSEVSGRSQALDGAEASEEQLATILRSVPVALYRAHVPSPTDATWISEGVAAFTGFPSRSFVETPEFWTARIHPDDRQRVKDAFQSVGAAGKVSVEYRWKVADGSYHWFLDNAVLVDRGGDGVCEVLGTFLDITERRRAEEAERSSEAKLRALFSAMSDVILVLDRDGRYLEIAPTNPALLYRPPEELIGKTPHEVFPKDQADVFLGHIRRVFETSQTLKVEYTLPIGGRDVAFSATLSPMAEDRVVLVARDISEERRLQQLQAAIYEISEATQTAGSLAELFRSIHAIIGRLMEAKNLYVALYDPVTEMVSFPYYVDEEGQPSVARKGRRGLTELILRTGKALLATPEVFEDLVRRGEVESIGAPSIDWLGVPLIVSDKTIGVLAVQTYTQGVRYGEREKEILTYVSRQAAIAIERKSAEEALARSESLLRAAFDHSAVEFWVRDAEGRCLMENAAAERHWGAQIGLQPEEVELAPEELAIWQENNRRALAGEVVQGEVEYVVAGEKRTFYNSVSPFRVGDETIGTTGINIDITERKRAEAALRESEQIARALINATSENAALLDTSLRVLAVNATVAESIGVSPEALLGADFFGEFGPEVGPARRVFAEEVVRTGKPVRFEDSRRGRWFDSTFYPVFDVGGAITRVAIFARDITDRRNAETALRESEERYRMLFQRAPVGVFHYDTQLRITDCNEYFVSLLRSRRDRLIGLDMSSLDDARVLPAIREAITGGTGEYDGPYRGTTGPADVIVSLRTAPLRGAGGAIMGGVGVVADMTEMKRAEAALRESEERYRTILRDMMEGYYEVDLKGTMTFCNDATVEMLGFPLAEIIGLNNRAFMDEANAKRVFEVFNRVYRTGEATKAFDWEIIRKDGRHIVVETSVALMRDADGRPAGFRGMLRDVTERKTLEEQLLQSQKMEVVGTLAGGVAHDFNNLLQAMLSHAQLLRSQSQDKEKVLAVARELEQHINRGAALTRQLLLFSRRETVKTERLDLNDAVRDTSQVLARLVRANIALVIETASQALPVEADRGQLQQILMNLTLNASDAMPDGGRLIIRTSAPDEAWVCLAVEDTGHGIPEAVRDRIFEPFFTTKEPGKGTGLGLAVVHGIVASHGGHIDVESTTDRGTTFSVFLPSAGQASVSQVEEATPSTAELALGQGERILVVEDEPGAREGLRDILTTLRYDVVAVGSAEEAENFAAGQPFDLLLTDLMLPGLLGPDLALRLQKNWPGLKIILMSGYADDPAVRRGVSGGTLRYLQKPFGIDSLARDVRAALDEIPEPAQE